MRVIGLDISLNTGYVDISWERGQDYKIEQHGVITAPVKKGMDRFIRYRQLATKLLDVVDDVIYDGIFMEGYSFSSRFNGITMGEIGAILRFFIWQIDESKLIVEIPPTSLKSFVTGKGNAKKEMMLKEVYKRWGFDAKNNDEADAFGLAMFGFYWLGMPMTLPKKNLAAFNKVKKEFKKGYKK